MEPKIFSPPAPSVGGKRVWLDVVMVVKNERVSNVVHGNKIVLARHFFPTFFNRGLNRHWIDNSRFSVSE